MERKRAKNLRDHAQSITQEPGFMWKIWTENPETEEAGGIYLFVDKRTALAYLKKHTARLKNFGATAVNAKMFKINEDLTTITKGPVR